MKLPGMLNAAIRECPVFGGKVKSFDAEAVETMPGVKKVVAVGDTAVAVVADTWWQAKTALDALPIEWDEGPNAGRLQRADRGHADAKAWTPQEAFIGNQAGDVKAALAKAGVKRVEAVYSYPYQHHATMEPMNATARLDQRPLRGLDARPRTPRPRLPPHRPPPVCRSRNATSTASSGRRVRPARPPATTMSARPS